MTNRDPNRKVLVVEDQMTHRQILKEVIAKRSKEPVFAFNPQDSTEERITLEWVREALKSDPGMMVLDLGWTGDDSATFDDLLHADSPDEMWKRIKSERKVPEVFELLEELDRLGQFIPVLILTKWYNVTFLMKLLRNQYRAKWEIISKPDNANVDEWDHVIGPYVDSYLRAKEMVDTVKDEFVGDSKEWINILGVARQYADGDSTILITGEAGIGKSKLAKAIHEMSSRSGKPFLEENIAAIPPELIASKLFGHKQGAFTGAVRDEPGLFRAAEGGTVFLDEIGDMPINQQVYLLRALEERTVTPVGGNDPIPIQDTRFICATNRSLPQLVEQGQFREDLYYRIHVLTLKLTPLRERPGDIPALVRHFIKRESQRQHRNFPDVEPENFPKLMAYNFPGNIRQLRSIVERALIKGITIDESLKDEETIRKPQAHEVGKDILTDFTSRLSPLLKEGLGYAEIINEIECALLSAARDGSTNNSEAAQLLKLKISTFEYKVRQCKKRTKKTK